VAYPLFLIKLLVRSGLARFLPTVRQLTDGGGEFLQYYSDRVLTAPLTELQEGADFLEVNGPDAVNLALGEPRFDLVPSASTKLPSERRGWPPFWGLPELRGAIAEKLLANQLSVNPNDEVLVTAGVAGALALALDTFVNPGDSVALFDPSSPLYWFGLRHRQLRPRWIPTWMEAGRIRFHMQPLIRALRGARLLLINSPANPTGGILAPEDLEQIAWWADKRNVLIFSDEVYERFCYESPSVSIGTLPKAWRRTLTVGSVSKSHGLASARVGWLAGHRHLVRPCALTAILQTALVPTLCQQVALAALRQGNDPFQPIRQEFESRRQYTFERLQTMGLKPLWPAAGFFIWIPVQELGMSGHAFAKKLRKAKRVLLWPGEFFGPSGRGHIRLSYVTEDGRLREGLTRLAEFVRELRGSDSTELKKAA
jgi:aspartate/methionine/tyrosine aminotransferase